MRFFSFDAINELIYHEENVSDHVFHMQNIHEL